MFIRAIYDEGACGRSTPPDPAVGKRPAPTTYLTYGGCSVRTSRQHGFRTSSCSAMADWKRHLGRRKRCLTEGDLSSPLPPACKWRRLENADEEMEKYMEGSDAGDEDDESPNWTTTSACGLSAALPVCDTPRGTDMVEESELAEMYGPSKPPKLAVYPFPPYAKTRREPTVVLDEDGYVVAGNLPGYGELPGLGLHNNAKPSPTSRERQPSKPAKALDGGAVPKPTLEYYKEGLERGILEFLGQNSALNDISPAAVFPPTVVSFGDKRLSSANDGVKRAESILSSICGGKQRSHKQDCGVKRPCQKQAQLKQKAKKQQQKGQVSTMSREKSVALFGKPEGDAMLDAGQGFVLVLDKSLDVLFVSENVYLHLGHHQVNLLGRSIEDLIHPKDLAALRWHLRDEQFKKGEADRVPSWMLRRMFYLGMNFSFQRPGCRSKESGYTLVQWNVKLRRKKDNANSKNVSVAGLVALCRPVRNSESILEIRLDGNMFLSRHDLSFHFIYCDPRIVNLIGYEPKDVLGRTVYQFHCPRDVIMCMHCHRSLMTNGSVKSTYYRFLSRTGAWVWLITHATIVYDTAQKPQYIVCRNYVVTHEEAERALSRDKSEFNRMRCLGFSLETELPLPKSVTVPKQLTMAHFSPLKPVDPLKRLDSIFSIPPVDVSSNPYVRRGRKSMRFEDDDFENPLVESRHESQRSDCSDSVISNSTVDSMQASTGVSDSPVMSIQTDRRLSQLSDTFSAYSGSCCMDIVPSSASTMLTVPQDSAMSETDLGTLDLGDEYTLSPDSDMIITQSDLSSGGLQPLKLQDLGQSPRMQNKTNVSTSVNDSLSNLNVMASLSSSMSVAKENDVLNAPFQSNQNIDPNSMLSDFSSFIMPEPGPQNFVDDLFAEETNIEGNLQNVLPMSGNMNTQHGVGTADEVNTSESFPGNFDLMWQSTPSVQVSIGEDFSAGLSSSQEGAQIAGNAVTLTSSPSTSLHNSQLPPSSLYSTPGEVESFLCGITDRITRKSIDFPSVYGQEEVEAADLLNETDVTTLLTNNGSDPFLNGMSMDTSEFPTDLDTNFTLKSTIPSCLSSQSPSLNEKSSMNASQGSPVSKITFMSSFDPTVMNSNKSSRPNQCSTLCFGVGGSNTCINICTPSSGSVSQASDNQFIPSQQTSASPPRASLGLEYESETLRRQSLLRTLLDKGETVQGPLTHEEWILTQSLSKQNDPKKDKCTKNEREVQATSKRHKIVKNGGRKSTELPLPQSSSLSSTSKFRKGGCDGKMKTKELPLPLRPCTSVSVTAGENRSNQLFSTCHQGTAMMQEQANYDSMANQQVPSERHIEMEDFDFPDDLLDLDVESCGPIGHDQAQALISDLSSNASWEDSLYTFIEAQIKAQVSSCMDQAPSQTPVTSTLASLPVQSSASCHGQGTSMSSSPPVGSPTGKTSLLRAAVTNPDMDKLIEQFPFHTAQTFSSQMPQQTQELPPCGPTVAQKVAAYEQSIMGSSPPLHTSHKVNCKISAPMKSPARMISSEKSDHEQSYFSNSKSPKTMSIFGKSPCSAAANVMRTSASPATSFPPQMSQMRRSTPQKSFSPPQTSPTSRSKTSSPRGPGSADPSSSSSEPVSVMVLRKESGRSRKSKSIAIQTESNSQEVYPEFELSASDTVMYPSVSFSSPPEASRRTPAPSVPSPASSAASPSMTELEKFLRGQSDAQDGSTHDGNSRDGSGAGTPFLQRLLTGELSRDNYQRLDQQMMEEERRETAFPSARCEMREHNFS